MLRGVLRHWMTSRADEQCFALIFAELDVAGTAASLMPLCYTAFFTSETGHMHTICAVSVQLQVARVPLPSWLFDLVISAVDAFDLHHLCYITTGLCLHFVHQTGTQQHSCKQGDNTLYRVAQKSATELLQGGFHAFFCNCWCGLSLKACALPSFSLHLDSICAPMMSLQQLASTMVTAT